MILSLFWQKFFFTRPVPRSARWTSWTPPGTREARRRRCGAGICQFFANKEAKNAFFGRALLQIGFFLDGSFVRYPQATLNGWFSRLCSRVASSRRERKDRKGNPIRLRGETSGSPALSSDRWRHAAQRDAVRPRVIRNEACKLWGRHLKAYECISDC